jgi:TRAP-type C4-dicarboxylate transport system substrate-binding protein
MLPYNSLGANPTPMAFGELFTALQQKTVDGQENPFENIYVNKLHEVQKFCMTTKHLFSPVVMLINLDLYKNKLTPDQRNLIEKTAGMAIQLSRELAIENEKKARDEMAKTLKVVDLTDTELKDFRDKMGPVYEAIRKKVSNDELVKLFLK